MEENFVTFLQISVVGSCLYAAYYLKYVVKKPTLYCNERLRSFMKKYVPLLFETFWPTFFIIEAKFQTVLTDYFIKKKHVKYIREMLTFPDGCQVALDWSQKFYVKSEKEGDDVSEDDKKRPIVIILPGLVGSSSEQYIQRLVDQCDQRGFGCVVLNYRGMAGVTLKSTKLYCAAEWSDLDCAVGWVHQHHPSSPLMAVGCSLGGAILTNYAASHTSSNLKHLSCSMAISIPWDFVASCNSLETIVNYYFFNRYLTSRMIKAVKRWRETFSKVVDFDAVCKSKSLFEFDNNFTSKIFPYKDALSYYKDASIHYKIHDIKIPYLCLNAGDDPFAPIDSVPTAEACKTANVVIATTTRGGHLGFVDAFLRGQESGYYERVCGEYFSAMLAWGGELKEL